MRSSPSLRRLSPARTTPAGTVMWSPCTRANSCGTTVSSPAGMTAPVMIFTHSPAATVPCQAAPAKAVPTLRSTSGWPATSSVPRKAKPSMAELSCGGTLTGETTSSASTRPSACITGTRCTPVTGATSRARNAFTASAGRACGS